MYKRPDVAKRNRENNPIWNKSSLEKMRAAVTGIKQSQATKNKRAKKLEQFNRDHPEVRKRAMAILQKKYTSKIRGTGWRFIRLKIIERDGEQCQHCGMSREEHKTKYGCDITVDHIDGNGKNLPRSQQNDNFDNLITLCLSCHGRKDSLRRWGKVS